MFGQRTGLNAQSQICEIIGNISTLSFQGHNDRTYPVVHCDMSEGGMALLDCLSCLKCTAALSLLRFLLFCPRNARKSFFFLRDLKFIIYFLLHYRLQERATLMRRNAMQRNARAWQGGHPLVHPLLDGGCTSARPKEEASGGASIM